MDQIRLKLASYFNEYEDCFVADSLPLEVCKLSIRLCSKIGKEADNAYLDKGY